MYLILQNNENVPINEDKKFKDEVKFIFIYYMQILQKVQR